MFVSACTPQSRSHMHTPLRRHVYSCLRDLHACRHVHRHVHTFVRTYILQAYVDWMPLKWNVHFIPLGFHCDGLYRTFQKYDFVGSLGPGFYKDLDALSQRFTPWENSRLRGALNSVFQLDKRTNDTYRGVKTEATGGHGHQTSKLVTKYYTWPKQCGVS